jgi:hypothetical protein
MFCEPRSDRPAPVNLIAIPESNPVIAARGCTERVRDLLSQSLASSSKRAYAADLAHFRAWGGTIPATPEIVAEYLRWCR